MATEVWVKAAGLMTMPHAASRASCTQSMISYSRLLWWKRRSRPSSAACARQPRSTSARVSRP